MTSEKAPDMATWAAEARHRIQEMRADVGHLSNDISSGNDDSKSLLYVDADFLLMARVHQAPDPGGGRLEDHGRGRPPVDVELTARQRCRGGPVSGGRVPAGGRHRPCFAGPGGLRAPTGESRRPSPGIRLDLHHAAPAPERARATPRARAGPLGPIQTRPSLRTTTVRHPWPLGEGQQCSPGRG